MENQNQSGIPWGTIIALSIAFAGLFLRKEIWAMIKWLKELPIRNKSMKCLRVLSTALDDPIPDGTKSIEQIVNVFISISEHRSISTNEINEICWEVIADGKPAIRISPSRRIVYAYKYLQGQARRIGLNRNTDRRGRTSDEYQ